MFVLINSVIFFEAIINLFNEIASLEGSSTKDTVYTDECNKSLPEKRSGGSGMLNYVAPYIRHVDSMCSKWHLS